jgi:ABC-2 type transport system ATP-binding protein
MAELPSIKAEGLVVTKEHDIILKGLDFSVAAGSITGLIGPSGSGKTTLMRAIAGVQKVKNGQLQIFGEPAGGRKLRRRLGYMAQSSSIYSDLSVVQNLRYFGTLLRTDKSRIEQVIETVQLGEYRHALAKHLSGGQQARVSLGIALLGDPELLILDEPTVGLDPLLRRDLWRLFEDLAAKGKTLLISSHVMDEAERCSDLLLMRNGELLWHDTKARLLQATGAKTVEGAFVQMIEKEVK